MGLVTGVRAVPGLDPAADSEKQGDGEPGMTFRTSLPAEPAGAWLK